uniref:transmembrane emp24 domain-containing protein 5-like n=1 Tax=Myxine glutinosa TaxID=7769 RepID=UPI00358E0746
MLLPGVLWSGLILHLVLAFPQSQDSDLTFALPAGTKQCFYQELKAGASMEVEYQVIDGAGLDVDFLIASPSGPVLYTEFRKSEGMHSIEAKENGDYMICFDNSFSHISSKLVFFEVVLDDVEEDEDKADRPGWMDFVAADDVLDMKLEDIQESMNSIKVRLTKSGQMQSVLRVHEARDRNLQENNFERVNLWSAVNLVVMLLVAGLQVFTLKSLFDDRRRVKT